MAQKNSNVTRLLQQHAVRLAQIEFGLIIAYIVFIIGSDAWNLVARQVTSERWLMAGTLLIITGLVWFFGRSLNRSPNYYRFLMVIIIAVNIALSTFAVYSERGMASRGVALYYLPVVASVLLLSRRAIWATATVCTGAYIMATTRYFYVYFNEGYKIELYSTVWLYSAGFFVVAAILTTLLSRQLSKNS